MLLVKLDFAQPNTRRKLDEFSLQMKIVARQSGRIEPLILKLKGEVYFFLVSNEQQSNVRWCVTVGKTQGY